MKLSYIIVSYNEKQYLPCAIESCLEQHFDESFEIIIGDDGSSDGSIDVIKEYAQKYPHIIKYFVMDRSDALDVIAPIRVSNVLKKAFSIAVGDYVTCMSGDDYLCDLDKIQKQIEVLDNKTQYASCYCGFKKVWNDGKEEIINIYPYINRALLWSGDYVHISCFVFRRESLKYVLDRICDDTGLMFSCLKSGKAYFIPRVMFAYRQRDRSIMHEADVLELNVLELLLYQDVKNAGGFSISSVSRFARPFRYVWKNRKRLLDKKYEKYLRNAAGYENNFFEQFLEYDKKMFVQKAKFSIGIFLSNCIQKIMHYTRRFNEIKYKI